MYAEEAEPLGCTFRIEKRDQYQPTPEPYIQEVRVIAGRTNIELSAWVSFKEVMTIPSWLIQQTGRQFFFYGRELRAAWCLFSTLTDGPGQA